MRQERLIALSLFFSALALSVSAWTALNSRPHDAPTCPHHLTANAPPPTEVIAPTSSPPALQGPQQPPTQPHPTAGMVLIPTGPSPGACDPRHDRSCSGPATVNLPSFYIDKTEVTVSDYQACVNAGACTPPRLGGDACNWGSSRGADHPINCVSYSQAEAFCTWRGKALPTGAQWEKAAVGTDGRPYPWGASPPSCDLAILSQDQTPGCGTHTTQPTGSRPAGASPYGVLDMVGNVSEWTNQPHEHLNPLRGSAFGYPLTFDHVHQPYHLSRDVALSSAGIRCVSSSASPHTAP